MRRATARQRTIRMGVALALAVLAVAADASQAVPAPAAAKKTAARAPDPAPAQTAWTRARALADEGRYPEALDLINAALRDEPDNTDLLWLKAGVTGWSGQHKESVALFEKLLSQHPELSPEIRLDLATQRISADDPAAALRDIDLYLAAHPGDSDALEARALALARANRLSEARALYDALLKSKPDALDLALDRAQVMGWAGKHDEASEAYQEILRRHPGNLRARMGLAQSLNASGQHRRAAAMYQEMLAQGEKDPEITKGLAYAQYWSGRPDRARTTLDDYLTAEPDDPEGHTLAMQLAHDQSRGVTLGYGASEDSDDLRVGSTSLEYRWPLDETTALSLRGHADDVRDPGGELHPLELGAAHEKIWSDRWSSMAAASYYRADPGKPAVGLGELNLTHRPGDRLRFDFGVAKQPVVTRIALDNDIRVTTVTAGLDWLAKEKIMVSLSQRFHVYNDDNQQSRSSAALRAWVMERAKGRLGVTFDFERLSSNHDLEHGYYDPLLYTELGPGIEIESEPAEGWNLGLTARIGIQHEQGADQEPYHSVAANLQAPLGHLLSLGLEVAHSNSNLTTSSGFAQTRWAVNLVKGI